LLLPADSEQSAMLLQMFAGVSPRRHAQPIHFTTRIFVWVDIRSHCSIYVIVIIIVTTLKEKRFPNVLQPIYVEDFLNAF
jgi:hypothetical protein